MAYQIQKINEKTMLIIDQYHEGIYLIEGQDEALLIDAGLDQDSLRNVILSLTDKKIKLVLTHGHIDHIGQSGEFDDVYMNLKDLETYESHMHMNMGHFRSDGLNFLLPHSIQQVPDRFDLGGTIIDILFLSGHTPGSIILIDRQNKAIYTGDAIGSGCGVWMQLDESLPINEYHKSLKQVYLKLVEMDVDETWSFYGGHCYQEYQSKVSPYNRLDINLLKDMIVLCEKLMNHQIDFQETHATAFTYKPYYVVCHKAEMIVTKEKI